MQDINEDEKTRIAPLQKNTATNDDKTRIASSKNRQETVTREEYETADSDTEISAAFKITTKPKDLKKTNKATDETSQNLRIINKRFLIESLLGTGGMGAVYKAKDLRKVEAEDKQPYVAVKVLNQDFKHHPKSFISLQQETVKSQKLAHPNIVTVYDFDRDSDTIYMTMELLDGTPLDLKLKESRNTGLTKDNAENIFYQLCAGLDYAHARNIIHSDFKPGNIFLTKDGTAKIFDFGIARAAHASEEDTSFDAGELGALTPAYASLEMLQGKPPSFSDDIYALSCVFYELLTGKHPYQKLPADKALEQSISPSRINSLTRREWKALKKGLSLKQSDRWATIDDFKHAFRPKNRLLSIAASISTLAICAAGWAMYSDYTSDQEQAASLKKSINTSQQCLEQKEYQCAIDNSLIVLSIDPENIIAIKINQQAKSEYSTFQKQARIDLLLKQANICYENNQLDCALVKLDELFTHTNEHINATKLQKLVKRRSIDNRISVLIVEADNCLLDKDDACAHRLIAKAQSIELDNSQVLSLTQRYESMLTDQQTTQRHLEEKITDHLSKAELCLFDSQYQCAIDHSDAALKLDNRHAQANRLRNSAELGMKRAKKQKKLIAGMLKKSEECLSKKNYSCAISTADAILSLNSKNKQAIELINKAKSEELQIKKSIVIQ